MSFTIVETPAEAASRDLHSENIYNRIIRRCKIGRVKMKGLRADPIDASRIQPFNPPSSWYPDPMSQPWQPIYVGVGTVMDHPRNCMPA